MSFTQARRLSHLQLLNICTLKRLCIPTVIKVISRLTVEDKGIVSYQSVDVTKHDLSVAFLNSNSAS